MQSLVHNKAGYRSECISAGTFTFEESLEDETIERGNEDIYDYMTQAYNLDLSDLSLSRRNQKILDYLSSCLACSIQNLQGIWLCATPENVSEVYDVHLADISKILLSCTFILVADFTE